MIRLFPFFWLALGCFSLQAQVTLNEILASNATVVADPQSGNFADFVELHNGGNAPADLSGWRLSDNSDPLKWTFPVGTKVPAGGFLLLWADGANTGLHTNYKLSSAGEGLVLYDASGNKVDEIAFGEQKTDISLGRKTDGSSVWGYFTRPTPGSSNQASIWYEDFVYAAPVFSQSGGFFDQPLSIHVQNLSGQGILRYTTNGADPDDSSPEWSQPLALTATTVVKARIFVANRIPGPVVTHTYFIGEQLQQRGLPVLSLSTHPDYFFAPDSGLYVQTFKPSWEYPLHIEMYQPDGILAFHHDAGVQVGGENSWILPEKLLNIYSRKQYGSSHFSYQLFPNSPRTEFGDLILRTSGNDWSNTLFRDNLMQGLIKNETDLDVQHYRHCSVFINGAYFGIHILTEKQDADYADFHQKIHSDSLDYIENNGEIKEGDAAAYQQMVGLLTAGVLSNAAFQALDAVCDTKNFTDYIISEIFTANTSWGHNIALFRKRSPAGKWRWFPHDYDRGFDLGNVNGTAMEWATATNGQDWSNPAWGTLFLRKMLQNDDFKQRFITRFADHLYVTYHPLMVNQRVDQLAGNIRKELPYHVGKWAGTQSSYGDGIPSVAFWEKEVDVLKQFGASRNAFMWENLNSFFSLNGSSGLEVSVSDAARGRVRLHELVIPQYPWSGRYFNDRPFTLTAEAKPGFHFVRWEKAVDSLKTILPAGSVWKYRDATAPPQADWTQPEFDDGVWGVGPAQLGYGDNDESTTLSFGSDASNKTISYYFRAKFDVVNPADFSSLKVRLVADDGAVVYVNGKEVWRYNMPSGAIDFATLASSGVVAPAENAWNEQWISANALIPGANVLAVEIHQSSASSSDLSFDLELSGISKGQSTVLGTDAALDYTLTGSPVMLRAIFESDGSCGILPDTIFQNLTLTANCSPYRAAADVVVKPNATLSVEPGVEIQMPERANLWVHGSLQINGTADAPILIRNAPGSNAWGGILLENAVKTSKMNYLTLENASSGTHRVYFPAAISAYRSNLEMDHLDLIKLKDNPIFSRFSDLTLTHSTLKSVVTGDCINVKQGHARVENCSFEGGSAPDMDAIDYDGVVDGIMRNNVIHDFRGDNCDGLDIGEQCQNLLIEGNFIYHCFDKGISVGQQSSATIRNNTIAYTAFGIALKDQSPVTIDHCTFFGNQKGVTAYEKNPGSLGGNGIITNCIVSNAALATYDADGFSSILVSNSLSDPDTLTGQGILSADPKFVHPTAYDFHLQAGSPALGAGTTGSDLGAVSLPVYTGQPQLMLSEILYNDTLTSTGEFLEILNPGSQAIDLSGFTLAQAVDFTFPAGAGISAGERIVVARKAANFVGSSFQVFEWTNGKLKDEGEAIHLFDRSGLLVDFVEYSHHLPWPEAASMYGKSLELVAERLDNHFATSWLPSAAPGGSPGTVGSVSVTRAPADCLQFTVYPNPAADRLTIAAKGDFEIPLLVRLADASGRVVFSGKTQSLNGLQSATLELGGLLRGHYVVSLLDERGRMLGSKGFILQ